MSDVSNNCKRRSSNRVAGWSWQFGDAGDGGVEQSCSKDARTGQGGRFVAVVTATTEARGTLQRPRAHSHHHHKHRLRRMHHTCGLDHEPSAAAVLTANRLTTDTLP
jgi:hypothetical protein